MDLIFIAIVIVWLLTESVLFYLEYESKKSPREHRKRNKPNGRGRIAKSTEESESGISSTQSVGSFLLSKFFFKKPDPATELEKRMKRMQEKRLARRENDRKKLLEYFAALRTDEDGYETDSGDSLTEFLNLLLDIVEYLRDLKIISIVEMANYFQLEQNELVFHMSKLQSIGIVNGVFDDRGKFIYVPDSEAKAVIRFIQQYNIFHWPEDALSED